MLFLHLQPTGSSPFNLAPPSLYFCSSSPSTARPPNHPLQSRSSIPSLLPCYFYSFSPPPVPLHHPFDLAPPPLASSHAISAALARPQLVHCPSHRIIPFDLASTFVASSHAISAAPARHRITPFNLASTFVASSHAISAAFARPRLVHRASHRIIPFDLASTFVASCHAISAAPSTTRPTGSSPSISLLHPYSLLPCYFCLFSPSTPRPPPVLYRIIPFDLAL